MSLSSRIYNLLTGSWKITRQIYGVGLLYGEALFEINPNNAAELFYSEKGIFQFNGGKSLTATRKYVYRHINDDIYVYFDEERSFLDDYRLFHRFNMNDLNVNEEQNTFKFKDVHLCGEDTYNVMYKFNLEKHDEFLIEYNVKGPNKDYLSETIFKKNL